MKQLHRCGMYYSFTAGNVKKKKKKVCFNALAVCRVLSDSTQCEGQRDRDPVRAVVFDAQPVISAWDRGGLTKDDSATRTHSVCVCVCLSISSQPKHYNYLHNIV